MKRTFTFFAAFIFAVGVFAQQFAVEGITTEFTAFEFPGQQVSSTIGDGTIDVWMPEGTDLTALTPSFTVAEGAVVFAGSTQVSSTVTTLDFSAPVILTVENGDDSQDWTVTVKLGNSISSIEKLDVSVYPNPTVDYVMVEGAANANITIYNILGRVVKTYYSSDDIYKVEMGSLTKGNYLLSVEKGSQRVTRKVTLLN